ncbi:hypothetical protein B5F70_05585 [Collinsella sp. An268]|nr:hypothetical protein B5F70_05585 [Collinsella sp. An268]
MIAPATAVTASAVSTTTSTAANATAIVFVLRSFFSTISRISSTPPLTSSSIMVPKRFARSSMLWMSGRVLPTRKDLLRR